MCDLFDHREVTSSVKVLHFISSMGAGGAERSLAELAVPLRDRGVEVSVLCLYDRTEGMTQYLREQSVVVDIVRARSWPGRVHEVHRRLRTSPPDFLHTTLFDCDVIGRLAAAGTGVPVVGSQVSTPYDSVRFADPALHPKALRAYKQVDAWTARHLSCAMHAVSETAKVSAVRELGVSPELVQVIPRARDLRRLGEPSTNRRDAARKVFKVPEGVPVLAHLGRQEWAKGLDVLLDALAMMRHEPAPVLLQAGRVGAASQHLARSSEEKQLGPRVHFLGHRTEAAEVLAAADVFVFPSRYEGMPGAILEAMALGLPIVATDIPAVREVVDPSFACLVPMDSAAALARELDDLLSKPDARQARGSLAREAFLELPTIERVADQTVDFYAWAASIAR